MSLHFDALDAHIRIVNFHHLKRIDPWIVLLIGALAFVGLATLYSANRSVTLNTSYYTKQAVFLGLGSCIALCLACLDYRFIVSLGPLVYGLALALLVAVLIVGTEVKGGQRWISLGFINLQPSEVGKIGVILMLAWLYDKIGARAARFGWLIVAMLIGAVPAFLVLIEPNLGTTIVYIPVVFAIVYVAGCNRWHLIALILAGLAAIPIGWTQLQDYQRTRILAFINPDADPSGSGYHTIQSMITVGSGGMTGKGYMQGTQTYLSYLPEHHSDFIFSLLAEEWGFIGGSVVIGLFALLFLRILYHARMAEDRAGTVICVGLVTVLAVHTFVNIAITMGIMPVTGIPLPFMSYGGSFYISVMTGIGLLLSVQARRGMFDSDDRRKIA